MGYVKHILLPGEHILYDGHVHPRVLIPGALLLGLAAWMLVEASNTGGGHSWLLSITYHMGQSMPWTEGLYSTLARWQWMSPNIAIEIKVLSLILAVWGISKFSRALCLMQTTELIVTDMRVIAKIGIMHIVTIEMDRRRIAGVTVDQSFWGRLMDYGSVYIQGFTTSIGGLAGNGKPAFA